MVLVAMTLALLIGAGALAIDIGAIWLDRSADQKITDSAAAAGALAAAETGGAEACRAAFAYVVVNSDDISSLDDSQCATVFAGACNAANPPLSVDSGRYRVTFTYPVLDGDDLMTSGIVGAGTQALDAGDGSPCERVGVEMTATRNSIFAQLMGFEEGRTTVHTVAITAPAENDPPINLLVLDRTGCRTLATEGGGGVRVDAVIAVDDDGNPIGLTHGIAAADSDGSACTTDGVIDLSGSGPYSIRADGPTCPDQIGTHSVGSYTAGEGCGRVQTFAPGTPGCAQTVNLPACSPGGGGANQPEPEPTALLRRLTRAPVDYRYNCWSDYTAPPIGINWAVLPLTGGQAIDGCTESDPDHIYDLIQTVGQNGSVAGFKEWNADKGYPCDIPSSSPPITVTDNIRVDCPGGLTIRADVEIRGDVVFDGDVTVTSSGDFTVRSSLGSPGFAFFRDGVLVKDGSASLTFEYTAVYMSRTSQVRMSGGSGKLNWIAPDSGDFDDLALWSDSPLTQFWAGQVDLAMEGVFFTPLATADYAGTSDSNQTKAQWIAYRLLARGGGTLVVRPADGRAVEFAGVGTQLIR
jgi:hypothetical protein